MTTLCTAKGCLDGHKEADGPSVPREARNGLLCTRCYQRLEQRLSETPSLVATTRRYFLTPGQGSSDGSRRTKGQPPIPLNAGVLDSLTDLTDILGSYTAMVCEYRSLQGPDRRNDPDQTSRFLLSQLDWISEQTWVDDFAHEVSEVTRKLRSSTRDTAEMVTLELACPYCQEQSLRARKDASSDVTCRTEGCQDERGEQPRWTRSTWALLLSEAS